MAVTLDLTGRRVLVTGAGGGIGRAISQRFGQAGARVVVNDVHLDRAERVAAELVADGLEAEAAAFDVTDLDAVTRSVAAMGHVDVLVNNAGNAGTEGFGARAPFAESDPLDWEPFLQVNLYGVLHCCRAVLPPMVRSGGGRIITVVSDAGRTGDPGGAVYGAAKAAAAALMRSLAAENGRFGITANSIALGTMHTDATDAIWSDPGSALAKDILRGYAVRRPGDPDEVAHLALFLATDHAAWITGQTYVLNGGYSFSL